MGAEELFLISGPCVIEEESVMRKTAEHLKEVSEALGIPLIFKSSFMKDNRSSVNNYMGPGLDEGLTILGTDKRRIWLPHSFGYTLSRSNSSRFRGIGCHSDTSLSMHADHLGGKRSEDRFRD